MKFEYTTYSIMTGLVFLGASLFNFIEKNSDLGRSFLLLAMMVFLGSYYLLKSLYYLKHQATFNEISFVVVLPLLILVQFIVKGLLNVNFDEIVGIKIESSRSSIDLSLDLFDISLIPYFLFSVFLLLRTNLRYPFIRFSGYSEKGLPPKLISLALTIGIPILFLIAGLLIFENAILVLFALIYGIVGFLAWFV